mmetsp:Transcript_25812/g.36138  ORF Transcript_25812/g.36138 Transcript_25812/m.36138 type:complete len:147 (-) Transcript_25812:85-525(-)
MLVQGPSPQTASRITRRTRKASAFSPCCRSSSPTPRPWKRSPFVRRRARRRPRTTASVEKKEAAISDKKAEKARLEKTLVQTRQGREGAEDALENLANTKAGLHESCDFLMQNFEARQAARSEEMDSVKKAKAILSGATFAEIQLD